MLERSFARSGRNLHSRNRIDSAFRSCRCRERNSSFSHENRSLEFVKISMLRVLNFVLCFTYRVLAATIVIGEMDTSGGRGKQEWRDTRLTQFRIWFRDQATISCSAFSVAKNKRLRLSDSN